MNWTNSADHNLSAPREHLRAFQHFLMYMYSNISWIKDLKLCILGEDLENGVQNKNLYYHSDIL